MSTDDRILIVGAGPVGLVTALRLAGFGIPSVVVEKSSEVPRDLRATTFHPPTLDMLEDMGVLASLEAMGIVTPAWQVLHLATRQRAVFEMATIGDLTRHPYRLQVEQFKLVKELFERARVNPLIDLRLDAEVSEVDRKSTRLNSSHT